MLNVQGKKIYLACGATDLRRSINGLVAIIQSSFRLDPFTGAIFAFCNKNRTLLKLVEWDEDGFWLYLKRLERGHFRWPQAGEDVTMELRDEELQHLLGSTKLAQKLQRQMVNERLLW
jgi:transposase